VPARGVKNGFMGRSAALGPAVPFFVFLSWTVAMAASCFESGAPTGSEKRRRTKMPAPGQKMRRGGQTTLARGGNSSLAWFALRHKRGFFARLCLVSHGSSEGKKAGGCGNWREKGKKNKGVGWSLAPGSFPRRRALAARLLNLIG
jgi:hypothetical protein